MTPNKAKAGRTGSIFSYLFIVFLPLHVRFFSAPKENLKISIFNIIMYSNTIFSVYKYSNRSVQTCIYSRVFLSLSLSLPINVPAHPILWSVNELDTLAGELTAYKYRLHNFQPFNFWHTRFGLHVYARIKHTNNHTLYICYAMVKNTFCFLFYFSKIQICSILKTVPSKRLCTHTQYFSNICIFIHNVCIFYSNMQEHLCRYITAM